MRIGDKVEKFEIQFGDQIWILKVMEKFGVFV